MRRSISTVPGILFEVPPGRVFNVFVPERWLVPGRPRLLSGRRALPSMLPRGPALSVPLSRRTLVLPAEETDEVPDRPQDKIQNDGKSNILHSGTEPITPVALYSLGGRVAP